MKSFTDLSEALNHYRSAEYTVDFNIAFDPLICQETGICLAPDEFQIVNTVRFHPKNEGDKESILFLIESHDAKTKGTLISAYGNYSNEVSPELLNKIHFRNEAPGL